MNKSLSDVVFYQYVILASLQAKGRPLLPRVACVCEFCIIEK